VDDVLDCLGRRSLKAMNGRRESIDCSTVEGNYASGGNCPASTTQLCGYQDLIEYGSKQT
jgi:hypothetical protein